jgi:hypothetical protein
VNRDSRHTPQREQPTRPRSPHRAGGRAVKRTRRRKTGDDRPDSPFDGTAEFRVSPSQARTRSGGAFVFDGGERIITQQHGGPALNEVNLDDEPMTGGLAEDLAL